MDDEFIRVKGMRNLDYFVYCPFCSDEIHGKNSESILINLEIHNLIEHTKEYPKNE